MSIGVMVVIGIAIAAALGYFSKASLVGDG
jgi:hypothetical protein